MQDDIKKIVVWIVALLVLILIGYIALKPAEIPVTDSPRYQPATQAPLPFYPCDDEKCS